MQAHCSKGLWESEFSGFPPLSYRLGHVSLSSLPVLKGMLHCTPPRHPDIVIIIITASSSTSVTTVRSSACVGSVNTTPGKPLMPEEEVRSCSRSRRRQ